jgi:predicted RNA-binding protein with PIN domain
MARRAVRGQAGPVHFIVDGMNVIGTEPDGWWRDRGAARRRLVEILAPLSGPGVEIDVVFDGRPSAGEEDQAAATSLRVSFAPGGRNSADDVIVEMVRGLERPSDTTVVTSDRALVERVRQLGAGIEGAKAFRARLPPPVPGDSGGREQGGGPS